MATTITGLGHTLTTVGPLPTTFSLSASCTKDHLVQFAHGDSTGAVVLWNDGQECSSGHYQPFPKDGCLPSRYGSVFAYNQGLLPVFSPATACPAGYGPSCTLVRNIDTDTSSVIVWDALSTGQTAIGCCPRGYACGGRPVDGFGFYYCASQATPGETITLTNVGDCQSSPRTLTVIATSTNQAGFLPQIVYLRAELTFTETASVMNTAPNTNSIPTPTQADSGGSSSTSLTPGAKAGISVSVVFVVIFIPIGIFMLYKRKKRTAIGALPPPAYAAPGDAYEKPELPSDDHIRSELHGNQAPMPELPEGMSKYGPSPVIVAELDGEEAIGQQAPQRTSTIPRKPIPGQRNSTC